MRKRPTARAIVILAATAVMAVGVACGDAGESSRDAGAGVRTPNASKAPAKSPARSPAASPPATTAPGGGKGIAATSADSGYDDMIGGLFQIVAVEISDDGGVSFSWVAAPAAGASDGGAALPQARIATSAGALEVKLIDTRPHADVTRPLVPRGTPIARLAWTFPPDDALVVVRIAMRDATGEPSATLVTQATGSNAGTLEVSIDE